MLELEMSLATTEEVIYAYTRRTKTAGNLAAWA